MNMRAWFTAILIAGAFTQLCFAPSASACEYHITAQRSPSTVCAGGGDPGKSTITVTIWRGITPVPNHTITFLVSGPTDPGTIPALTYTTDSNGVARTSSGDLPVYTSGSGTGTVTVTATDESEYPPYTARQFTVDVYGLEVSRGLPTGNLNNDAGANRWNIRWADTDPNVVYGDDFTLPSGQTWTIDKLSVWVIPDIPVSPTYQLGDHFSDIYLYTGLTSSAPTQRKHCTISGNTTSDPNVTLTKVTYQADPPIGNANYQAADGTYNQMWRIDFNNLYWYGVTGGTSYAFFVRGVPIKDRLWFNHATYLDQAQFLRFDTGNPGVPATADGSEWFGKGSNINVEVYAH